MQTEAILPLPGNKPSVAEHDLTGAPVRYCDTSVPSLRVESAQALVSMDFPGYAIGGLAVGEPQAVMIVLQRTANIWDDYFDQVKSHIIRSLVERVTLHEDDTVEVSWRTDNWIPLLETMKPRTTGAEMLELEMAA